VSRSPPPAGRALALFDFDGTISQRDTLLAFLRHTHSTAGCLTRLAIVSPVLAAHAAGVSSAATAKATLLRAFYGGWHRDDLNAHGRRFAADLAADTKKLHAAVLERFTHHVNRGDEVCIVSASPAVWVRPFAHALGAQAICTELEYDHAQLFTGRLLGPNVNGGAKAAAIEARYNLAAYARVVAYGNSRDDLPMLRLAHEAYLVRRGEVSNPVSVGP